MWYCKRANTNFFVAINNDINELMNREPLFSGTLSSIFLFANYLTSHILHYRTSYRVVRLLRNYYKKRDIVWLLINE